MRMTDNCRIYQVAECPYLRSPRYHSGYTGKSGEETWWMCNYHRQAVRNVKKCALTGDPKLQRKNYLDKRHRQLTAAS